MEIRGSGQFGYTGQAWLPELGMWYYKARIYNPANNVGRFMQSDPIGYGGGMNLYAYVSGDPVNKADPLGLSEGDTNIGPSQVDIVVNALRFDIGTFNSITPNPAAGVATVAFGSGVTLGLGMPVATSSNRAKGGKGKGRSGPSRRLSPGSLFSRFLKGEGEALCLTDSEFGELVGAGRVRSSIHRRDGTISQLVSFYGTPYENSFGTATIIRDRQGNPIQFYDYYEFDVGRGRSLRGEAATFVGMAIGTIADGEDYAISYNFGSCSQE